MHIVSTERVAEKSAIPDSSGSLHFQGQSTAFCLRNDTPESKLQRLQEQITTYEAEQRQLRAQVSRQAKTIDDLVAAVKRLTSQYQALQEYTNSLFTRLNEQKNLIQKQSESEPQYVIDAKLKLIGIQEVVDELNNKQLVNGAQLNNYIENYTADYTEQIRRNNQNKTLLEILEKKQQEHEEEIERLRKGGRLPPLTDDQIPNVYFLNQVVEIRNQIAGIEHYLQQIRYSTRSQ